MPTQDAGTIGLLDAPEDVGAVLEVAKTHGMAVASTHASFADTEMLVDLADSIGLVRLLVTNPVARFGAGEGSQLLSQDLYIELPFLSYYPAQDAGNAFAPISTKSGPTAASSRRTSASGRTLLRQRG